MSREIEYTPLPESISFTYECIEADGHVCSKCGDKTDKCCALCKKCYKFMTRDCPTVRRGVDGVFFPRDRIYPSAEVLERDAMRLRTRTLQLNGGISKPAQSERELARI